MKIGIIGAGYVGLTTAVCLARKNHSVFCADKDENKIEKLRRGCAPFFEPVLNDYLSEQKSRLFFTTDTKEVVQNSEVVFLAVETPFVGQQLDYRILEQTAIEVGKALKHVQEYRVIVVKSTVLPNTTQSLVKPVILQHSQKSELEVGFCMNPEFMREGTAVGDMEKPDRIVLGVTSEGVEEVMRKVYSGFPDTDILVTNLATAEMIKYVCNTYFALNISYANEIARICEKLPGVDSEEVFRGLLLDKRMSPIFRSERVKPELSAYLKSGCGFGGSCFPKDVRAFTFFQQRLGLEKGLIADIISVNDNQIEHVFNIGIENYSGTPNSIAVLGTAFKPDTDDVRESPGIKICKLALEKRFSVFIHDELALNKTKLILGISVHYCEDVIDAIKAAEVIFVTTAAPRYLNLTDQDFETNMRSGAILVDCRSIYGNREHKFWRKRIGFGMETLKTFTHSL